MNQTKKTLFFSNIEGNIMEKDESVKFNSYMEEYIRKNLNNDVDNVAQKNIYY